MKAQLPNATKATHIAIEGNNVLYIYCPVGEPMQQSRQFLEKTANQTKEAFEKVFPNTKILVGFHDLKFTEISLKQGFTEKLKGTAI